MTDLQKVTLEIIKVGKSNILNSNEDIQTDTIVNATEFAKLFLTLTDASENYIEGSKQND
jgi:hypothetical protein